jgi:cytochrome P450
VTSTVDVYYDPYDAGIDADPHPVWKRLRDEAPAYYNERHDFWAVSRYDDVLNALLDWETFSSARGIVVEMIDTDPDAVLFGDIPGMLPMMIMMDPPRHDRLRKLVSRAFTPRRVAALEVRMREMCAEFLDPHLGGEPFDIMEECAAKVPGMVIGAIMGVPEPDQNELRIWIDAMMRWDPDGTDRDKAESVGKLWKYMQDLVAQRRDHPRDDMISDLHAARIADADGGGDTQLTFDEVFGFTQLLIAAGNETTARLLGWTSVLLARHPDQRRILLDDPSVVPNAIEELLRYESPSPIQGRFVTRDVDVAGTTIPAGSRLAILNASANRDDRHFEDPDRFDVTREIDRHLAFGYGVHFCLGAALARLEGRVVLEEMLARFPDWQVDESSIELVHTSTVRGPHTLQVHP